MWGLRAELPARDCAQEKAKPSAVPTTAAVKRSGSMTIRQVPWNVYSIMEMLLDKMKRIGSGVYPAVA
jgi:hypothetical protein